MRLIMVRKNKLLLLIFFLMLTLMGKTQTCPVVANFEAFQICGGDPVRFKNTSFIYSGSIVSWFWDYGDGNTLKSYVDINPEHQYIGSGKRAVKLVLEHNSGCKDSIIDTITLKEPLVLNLGTDFMLCGDEKLVLKVSDSTATCLWSTGETTNSIEVGAGIKTIWVKATKGDCQKSDTISILKCTKNVVGVPAAFTPNGDGINDVLYVYGNYIEEMDFKVFNRYAQMIFASKSLEEGWDGTYGGTPCESEVYVYYLFVKFKDGYIIERSGNITLIR